LADRARQRKHPDKLVTYIIDRNINYTNVCDVYCKFCAFYRTEKDKDHYVLSTDQICQKIQELVDIGGVQILLQGGHHPKLSIDYYFDLLQTIRRPFPAGEHPRFLAARVHHFADVFKMPLDEVIRRFKDAGLGSIPGGGRKSSLTKSGKRMRR